MPSTADLIKAARIAHRQGDAARVNALLAEAESQVDLSDGDGLTELWSAIGMERMGDFSIEAREAKYLTYLGALAEGGNPVAQSILAGRLYGRD